VKILGRITTGGKKDQYGERKHLQDSWGSALYKKKKPQMKAGGNKDKDYAW